MWWSNKNPLPEVTELKHEVFRLEKRVWILEHPFKFNVGDKVKCEYPAISEPIFRDGIITKRIQQLRNAKNYLLQEMFFKEYEVLVDGKIETFYEELISK